MAGLGVVGVPAASLSRVVPALAHPGAPLGSLSHPPQRCEPVSQRATGARVGEGSALELWKSGSSPRQGGKTAPGQFSFLCRIFAGARLANTAAWSPQLWETTTPIRADSFKINSLSSAPST